ncbi:hypothetical protein FQN50_003522 [Emmonsiellopsis sp. PD_5]|nr:hypothetical protein FQN50_003522 [Emmonsiellopsis sp. PD_5]
MRSPVFSLLLMSVLLLAIAVVGAEQNGKRQLISIDPVPTDTATDKPPTKTTDPPTETSTPPPETTSESTTEPPKTTTSATPTDNPTSSSTTTTDKTTPPPSKTNKPPPPSKSSVEIVTNTITVSGSVIEQTSTSIPSQTAAPGLGDDNGGSGSSSGLSTGTRNIIIGVVVGVGGAVILGGLAFVAWRLRRKRNARGVGDDDDLMNAGTAVGSSSHETSTMGTANSPFKSTLDQYHNPRGVNPSSNF